MEKQQPAAVRGEKILYLESLRGLAALQVLFLHIAIAFLPSLFLDVEPYRLEHWFHLSPFFFVFDGTSAVYIFFLISGYVLTPAFGTKLDRPVKLVAGRICRLLIPAFFACLLSYSIKLAVGDSNIRAGTINGSQWLRTLWNPPPGIWFFLKDALLNSLFLGYPANGGLASGGAAGMADAISRAYVLPLWTLSVELQGSLLILLLVLGRHRGQTFGRLLLGIALAGFFRTHFMCFIIGHLLAMRPKRAIWRPSAGGAVVFLGIILCIWPVASPTSFAGPLCGLKVPIMLACTAYPEKVVGSVLIFLAVISVALFERLLSARPLVVLGRYSFPIYLVHWPVIFGLATALFLAIEPAVGLVSASLISTAFSLLATAAIAAGFSVIDRYAIRLSRAIVRKPVPAD